MRLNTSQLAVAQSHDPRVLVLAGAGTGKTATSVHWVSNLIRGGAKRSQFLMITFTRKGASEMGKRIEKLIQDVPKSSLQDTLTIGTYHAVAGILLRKEAKGFGLPHKTFTTIDESEANSIWKSALKQIGLTSKSALYVPDRLNSLYSYSRNTCKNPTEVFEPFFKGHTKKMVKAVQLYEDLKRAANVVDYDDLLVLWVKRMVNDPDYAKQLQERWKYVLVDEIQDNNRLNEAVLDALNPSYLMAVGDANQSIYGFRGSDVRIISEFGNKNKETKILKLENNYRSGQRILDLANIIVSKTECPLILTSSQESPGRIEYTSFTNPQQEAIAISEWIQKQVEAGKSHSHLAILARSSRHLDPVEIALITKKIFFKKYGGQSLADSAEIKDFISFLRVAHNPLDKIALLRALMLFPGIGEGTAAKTIEAHAGEKFNTEDWPVSAKELIEWVKEIQKIKKIGDQGQYLYDKIRPLILSNYPKDCEKRNNTIHNLVEAMKGSPETPLAEFLDGFVLSRSSNDFHPDDAVVLSTVHSAKGLEWEGVWIVGCGATQIPHPRTLNDKVGQEEERRLFYVAVTRAKQHLVISYPGVTDRKQNQGPSPFIPENSPWRFA